MHASRQKKTRVLLEQFIDLGFEGGIWGRCRRASQDQLSFPVTRCGAHPSPV